MIVGSSTPFITKKTKILLAKAFDARQNDTMVLCHIPEIGSCWLTGDNAMASWGGNLQKGGEI